MRGANLVANALAAASVRTVFTLSGNQIMPIFDACIDAGIRLIHVRHEAAAVYMADAWSQLTGDVGIALITAAPGFANGLSPLYTARASESAVVLLSGDAPLAQEGRGAFQELRQTEVSAPLCKAAIRSREGTELGEDIARAIWIARSGRPGPVHLALPFDLLNAQVVSKSPPAVEDFERQWTFLDPAVSGKILKTLTAAGRPLVLTGPALNASRAGSTLQRLSQALNSPVVSMESPRGLRDPALGDFARVLPEVDVVLILGKVIDFTLGFGKPPVFAPNCRFMVVDPESEFLERAKRILGDNLIIEHQADADAAAEVLVEAAAQTSKPRSEWCRKVATAIASRPDDTEELSSSGRILPAALCRVVQQVLDAADDPILICDGGEFGQWAQACLSAPTRIINGPAGAIGGGLCYAIAAKINRPDATVVALMGDGTVGFHLSEFETALRCDAPIIAIIGHDARWNAEFQIQLRDYGPQRLIGCELGDTRYDLAAAGLGCHGEHVTHPDELAGAFQRAIQSGLPACVNVRIEGLAAPSGSAH
ncbi:MAG: thiamine pyrophosphate-binding protein [Betaproteobacteria bacterium]|nr:thiamine pyrophosphate-binding protein [Gammaproteobacteria bacterium]MDH3435723.1 thiamine pyrophosphate-binding protein [Betaproteobacteria bacterium]